jgi:hypothetical protein
VNRLLTLLMIFALVVAHGTSVAAAICSHESVRQHAAARQSPDAGVSAVALREEAADSHAARKAALADAGSISWVFDILPAPGLAVPPVGAEAVVRRPAPTEIPAGISLRPLLEPPAA